MNPIAMKWNTQIEFGLTLLPVLALLAMIGMSIYFGHRRRTQRGMVEIFLRKNALEDKNEDHRRVFTLAELIAETKCDEKEVLLATINNPKIMRLETIKPGETMISKVQFCYNK